MPATFLRHACSIFHLLCPEVILNWCLQCQSSGGACHEVHGKHRAHCDCLQHPDLEVPLLRRDDTRGRIIFRKYAKKPKNKAKQEHPKRQGDLAAQVSTSLNIQELHEYQAGEFYSDQTCEVFGDSLSTAQ